MMVRRLRGAAATAVLASVAAPRPAEAAPVLRIEWPAVPGCPAADVVAQHARTAIARAKEADDVLAIAEVTPPVDGAPWQLRIRTRTVRAAGERTLEGASCDAIARAAGLLVALAALRTRPPSAESTLDEIVPAPDRVDGAAVFGSPAAPLALPPMALAGDAPAAKVRSESDTRFSPSAGIGVATGLLPRVGVGPFVLLGYEARWLRARVGLRALLSQEELRWGLGASFSALGASADVCARLPAPAYLRTTLHACGGGAIDDVHGSGRGGKETFDVHRTAVMAFAGLSATWDVGRTFRIGADVRAGGAAMRPRFLIDSVAAGERELHRAASVRAEGALTFGASF